MAVDPRVLPAEEGGKLVQFMFAKSATRRDLLVKVAIVAGGVFGIGLLVWLLFRPSPMTNPTPGPSGVSCAVLERGADALDLQHIPLQSGMSVTELNQLVTCGGPHAAIAKSILEQLAKTHPTTMPPVSQAPPSMLELTARSLDAAGVPLQSGMSCAELLTLSKTGEQHSPIAGALYAQYCAAVVIPPPTGGGGGGGARTQ